MGQFNKVPERLTALFAPSEKPAFKYHALDHHMCHAASCFYPSGFDEAAILTIDGAGEWATAMLAHGKGTKMKKLATTCIPYSLGAFYDAIAQYLGFTPLEGAGKLMGLASYGARDSDEYMKLRRIVTLLPNGMFCLDMSYFSYHYTRKNGVTRKFINTFGPESKSGEWEERHLNMAAAAQRIVEDVMLHLVRKLKEMTNARYLCLAGGVALNSVANGLIARTGLFESIFIQPAAGDSGTSMGAAMLIEHALLGRPRGFIQKDAFLGPCYSSQAYEQVLKNACLPFRRMEEDELYAHTAKRIYDGHIVGWFQDRMEFGPRALGNRSLLATPLKKEMKDILNCRVKFREKFRPFAAIVMEEDAGEYFDLPMPNPYMLFVYHVKEPYRQVFPAITHVDHSVRIQTVNQQENPKLYKLLQAFKKISGYSVLINTSFNIKKEPIVCSPADAVESFRQADMDCLLIGDYLAEKQALAAIS